MDLKGIWKGHYASAPAQLEKIKQVRGVASVFNANIDAVLKVRPEALLKWMEQLGLDEWQVLNTGAKRIDEPADVLRGFLECFSKGIAEEWLVSKPETFLWMRDNLGQDRQQMGGQGGIIANVMAVTGVGEVYVHCASHPAAQAGLFLDRGNLLSTDAQGALKKASAINRSDDMPLVHWILEFDKGAEIRIGGLAHSCPKSNRFIATYDPLNFVLHIDQGFSKAMRDPARPLEAVLLSGFQMLSEPMQGGGSGLQRVEQAWKEVEAWKAAHPGCLIHFEFASTQDIKIRAALAQFLAPKADSVGCNEQEEIQILEVIGEGSLARECAQKLDSVSLFKGLLRIFETLKVGRIQLHMFGLYLTLAREDWRQGDEAIRAGMTFAATLAAGKAGTGTLEREEGLLWAHGREVAPQALKELEALAAHLKQAYGIEGFGQSGIAKAPGFRIIAVPTILIEKPVTLVGMGDTISSLSLIGAR
jgi:ADP-dependent phosphofructokinase/glucokinase